MHLRTFVFEFPVSGAGFHKVEIHANDQFAALRLLERQYGKVTVWKTYEKKEAAATTTGSSGGSQPREDDGEWLIALLGIVAFSPLVAIVGGPAWFVYDKLSAQNTHLGIVVAAILGTLLVAVVTLYLIFALVPQSILVVAGFGLYGAIGYALGPDPTWKAIIGGGLGILGAVICYFMGSNAKSGRDEDSVAEERVVALEDDEDVVEATVPPPPPPRRAKARRLH